MGAEVGLATSAVVLDRPLPAGPLRRRDLWEACHSTANPALTELTGEQLADVLARGNDPEFQQTTTRPLRGKSRGPLHVAGVEAVEPDRTYRVAATDFELEPYGVSSARLAPFDPLRLPDDHPRGDRGAPRGRPLAPQGAAAAAASTCAETGGPLLGRTATRCAYTM